ncbi:MAG: sodium:solute symporter family protein [Anaerolineales bacterium]|nr:sodium:solute symporter family protein [Anaerolineales bacterium]MDW8227433.1 sodium:solute symporter family protein [Anaerolineales bacterium]
MDIQTYQYSGLIIGGIVVILIIRLAIGYWASKKVETSTDYVLAGRRLPLWMAAPSIMATWFAAETLMGSSSEAYSYGFQGVVFDPFGATLCLLIAGMFIVRLARRAQYVTIMDFFQQRYGTAMSLVGTITQIITYFGWTAAQIVAGGAIVTALLGWPLWVGMVMVAVIVTLYTMAGGLWADTALDFMQMFLTAFGLLMITIGIIIGVGGLDNMLALAGAQFTTNTFALWPTAEDGYYGYFGMHGWFYYIAAWLSLGLGAIPAQDYLQRTCAAKNEDIAVKSTFVAAALYLGFGVLSPLIGVTAYGVFGPNLTGEQTEFLLVSMAMKFLHPVLAAIFIAALASALMSTSDSSMLAGATMFTENIVKVFKPDLSDKAQLRLTRLSLLVGGILSLLIALYASTIYKLAVLANTSILVGMAAPYIIGYYWKKANHAGALASFFSGVISWIVLTFVWMYTYILPVVYEGEMTDEVVWDSIYIASTPAFFISVVFLIVVSLLTQKIDPPKPFKDIHGNPVDTRNPFAWSKAPVLEEEAAAD